MVSQHILYAFALISLCTSSLLFCRSVNRPYDTTLPKITTEWINGPDKQQHSLPSPYLEHWAIFERFNKDLLLKHTLPEEITYRYDPTTTLSRAKLEEQIEDFLSELLSIKRKHHNFKNFTILKDRDFNYKTHSGVIIVKFKKYPFIAKLFRETPKTFTRPYTKGIQPCFFFVMGGGINRYLAGFTRIPNLYALKAKIASDSYWSSRLTTPRKWFYIPQDTPWFSVTGENIGTQSKQKVDYPSVYGIICDAIDIERSFNVSNRTDRKIAMKLARFIGNKIDPHIDNFVIEKNTGKIAFIDTEHFASMVGLENPFDFNHYSSWYIWLGNKCVYNALFRNKAMRKELQTRSTPEILVLQDFSDHVNSPAPAL